MVLARLMPAVPIDADWYISNGSGMLLEKTYKTRALRSEYAVSVQILRPENTPAELRKYYTSPWRIECRVLYENNERIRTQWVFKDAVASYLVAAISNDGSGFIEWYDDNGLIVEEQRLDVDGSGYFISYIYRDLFLLKTEVRIVEPRVSKQDAAKGPAKEPVKEPVKETIKEPVKEEPPAKTEQPAAAETEAVMEEELPTEGDATPMPDSAATKKTATPKKGTASSKKETASQKNAAQKKEAAAPKIETEPPTEAARQRAAQMVRNPQGPVEMPEFFVAASGKEGHLLWTDSYRYTRASTLRAIERIYSDPVAAQKLIRVNFPRFVVDSPRDKEFVSPGNAPATDFLPDRFTDGAQKVTYITDNRRRILSETRRDESGEIITEINNVWERDRIAQILLKSKGEERRIEFTYNSNGDRIGEKNYRNNILERTVTIDKDREIEELYLDGELALRAIWQDGKKISEERVLNRRTR